MDLQRNVAILAYINIGGVNMNRIMCLKALPLIALSAYISTSALKYNIAQAATTEIKQAAVVDISTPNQSGYAIYWERSNNNVILERSEGNQAFIVVAETTQNYYLDFDVQKDRDYIYRIGQQTVTPANQGGGTPIISDIQLTPGAVSAGEATLIVTFKTNTLAKAQVRYGKTEEYGETTELTEGLNQSHTLLINKLQPGQTYHIKAVAQDTTGKQTVESNDQTVTTSTAPETENVLAIIVKALQNAFAGFGNWVRKS